MGLKGFFQGPRIGGCRTMFGLQCLKTHRFKLLGLGFRGLGFRLLRWAWRITTSVSGC